MDYRRYIFTFKVICYIFIIGAISFNGTNFGPGNSDFDVFFTNVTCTGHEKNFLACQYFRTNSSMCPHTRDAGVRCLPGPGK